MGFPVLSFSGATGKHLFLLFSQKVFFVCAWGKFVLTPQKFNDIIMTKYHRRKP